MASIKTNRVFILGILVLAIFIGTLLISCQANQAVLASSAIPVVLQAQNQIAPSQPISQTVTYLPITLARYPYISPFGIESSSMAPNSPVMIKAAAFSNGIIRMNARISWRELQPNLGDPIQFSKLANFEAELRALKTAKLTPDVIVDDYPGWATVNGTYCGALQPQYYPAFANFMRSIVSRYKSGEFNVHIWELGNEPDVDPSMVAPDSMFGCWGDKSDEFYGGRAYGEMLKVVAPIIRAADPKAQVWIGGLLLATPGVSNPGEGRPEDFLQGILESGAGSYFDALPYHWYSSYWKEEIWDFDNQGTPWDALGGGTIGKARFLRQVMQQYGINKPLYLNETALGCPYDWTKYDWCQTPKQLFFTVQSYYLVRSFVRGLSERISGFTWYTLDGPGWRNTGLLDQNIAPRPAYVAYKVLVQELNEATYMNTVYYSNAIEAYSFLRGRRVIQVVWAKANQTLNILVPQAKYFRALNIQGAVITPSPSGSNFSISVGFSPIYIELKP